MVCGTYTYKKPASSKKGGIHQMIVLGRKIKNHIRSLLEVNYILILGFIGSKSVRVSHKRQYLRRLDFEPITIRSQ